MNIFSDQIIDPRELRIGNYLSYEGKIVHVTMLSLDIDDEYQEIISFCDFGKDTDEKGDWNRALFGKLNRIPLTAEWLTKLGFDDQGKNVFTRGHIKIGVSDNGGANWVFYFEQHLSLHTMSFVHQLQNLYFALTCEELTIKETV
jgi:hypothetical protein